jgi:hypothetical protein
MNDKAWMTIGTSAGGQVNESPARQGNGRETGVEKNTNLRNKPIFKMRKSPYFTDVKRCF